MEATQHGTGADLFADAAQRVVDYLNTHTPISDWSVSRVTEGEQVHLHVQGEGLLSVGDRVPWDDTFCRRMVGGAAHVVPDARADPDYADLADEHDLRAYTGYPIAGDDGDMFGVLCGIAADPLPHDAAVDGDLVALMSTLLGHHLAMARRLDRDRRAAESLAHTDDLTGLLNRRGWEIAAAEAQRHLDAFGDPVALAVLDLDGLKAVNDTEGHVAGDALLRRAADALRSAAGPRDSVARFGGDEFTVLSPDVGTDRPLQHVETFARALEQAGVAASAGHAAATPSRSVLRALREADTAMYAQKTARTSHPR